MQTIVYQCDTAMPAQKLPNCCGKRTYIVSQCQGHYAYGGCGKESL